MENLLKDIELQKLRTEVKELQTVKLENERYKKSIKGFDNAVKSYAWKERINPKIKKLSEVIGASENNILSQFYRILDRETYIKIDCFKTVYMLENDLPDCSTFEVLASFESSRNCFEFLIDKILELKQ